MDSVQLQSPGKSSSNESRPVVIVDAARHAVERTQISLPELAPSLAIGEVEHIQPQPPAAVAHSTALRCSKLERENLRDAIVSWRNHYWAGVRSQYPFFSREWILTDENIDRLVDKAQVLLNQPSINIDLVKSIIWTIMPDTQILSSLVTVLDAFCTEKRERDAQEVADKHSKRACRQQLVLTESENINPRGHQDNQDSA